MGDTAASNPSPSYCPSAVCPSLKAANSKSGGVFRRCGEMRRLCFRLGARKIGDNLFLTKRGGRKNERREAESAERRGTIVTIFTSFSLPPSLISPSPLLSSSSSSLIAAKLLFLAREMGNFYAREKEGRRRVTKTEGGEQTG